MQYLFRQIHNLFRSIFIEPLPIWANTGVGVLYVLLLFEVGEILAVAYGHTPVLSSFLVEDCPKVVKLPFATKGINHRAFASKKKCTQVVRLGHFERISQCRTKGTFLFNGERILLCRVILQTLKGRIHSNRLKRKDRDVAHVVADMFGIDFHNSREWLCDSIDSKRLWRLAISRCGVNDAGVSELFNELSIDWIFHVELILSVSFFRHLAGYRIR